MANDKLQIEIDAVDKATETLQKVQKELGDLQGKTEKTGKSLENLSQSNESLGKSFFKASVAADLVAKAISFVTSQFTESIDAANNYQRSVVGLSSTAAAFGESQDAARVAAQRLSADGLLNVADSSKALQNLLTTGIGLDKAEQLMAAYKNQAALGRVQNISFSQAVSNLAESFLTESSAIGNLSGQSENYNQIIERGAAILGKNVASLTDAERQQAKFIGTMELGKVVAGDLQQYLETADAQAQRFANTVDHLHILFGQALSPAVMFAAQSLSEMASGVNGEASPALASLAKGLVYLVGVARVTAKIFIEMGQAIVDSLKPSQTLIEKIQSGDIVGAIKESGKNAFKSFKDSALDVAGEIDKVSQEMNGIFSKIDTQGLNSFGNVFKDKAQFAANEVTKAGSEIADKLKKIGADIGKELESYAKTSADKIRSFQDNLRDLVIKHRDAIADLRSQIQQMNDDFAQASADHAEEHTGNRDEIIKKYEDETRTLKDNLARRLTDSKGSDEQIIAFFQAQLAEKEQLRDEELRKEDERYTKEETRQQVSFAKQLNAVQTKLNAELEIERKHQAEFNQFKDAVEEDDITRLQQSFEREMNELKRQHDERMAELRKEQEEILSVKEASTVSAARKVTETAQSRKVELNVSYTDAWMRKKFHDGGVVPGVGEVPILAKGGETVLTQQQTQGLLEVLKNIGSGVQSALPNLQMTNHIYNQVDLVGAMREMGWRTRVR